MPYRQSPAITGLRPVNVTWAVAYATFVNTLSQALEMPPVDKQGLLEAPGISERCGRLIEVLRFRLAELDAGGSFEPGTLH